MTKKLAPPLENEMSEIALTVNNSANNEQPNGSYGAYTNYAASTNDETGADAPAAPTPVILSTRRAVYDHQNFDKHYAYEPPPKTPWNGLRRTIRRGWRSTKSLCSMSYLLHWFVLEHFPMIDWVRHYNVRTMLTTDILAGITCGIMQVPQGMAYGMLSGAGPIVGLYTAFVPPAVYSAFASSRHVSVASFAVLSMLTASVIRPNVAKVKQLLFDRAVSGHGTAVLPGTTLANSSAAAALVNNSTTMAAVAVGDKMLTIVNEIEFTQFVTVRLATSICLACAILLLAFGLLRLGFISCYLSDALIAGFCAGAAVHIFTTQLFPALGLSSSNPEGFLMLYHSYKELFTQLPKANLYTAGLSAICVAILYVVKTYINGNPRILKKIYGVPIPAELVLVVVTTILSYYLNFSGPGMKIKSVGKIPVGLIAPSVPDIGIAMMVFTQTIIISFVILALTISIGRVLAKKNNTPIDASTELRALGLCNLAGAFYQCIPAGCAMARTMVLAGIGAPTQLTNFIGCAIVFVVLQWLGKLLEPLPGAVLAAIVIVAVRPLFMTITECWRLLHVSWVDASIYLVTFFAIILGEVGFGIVIGLAYSIFTIVIRTQYPHVYVLGRIRNTELYQPLGEYRTCSEIPGIRILRIAAPIYFANVDFVRTRCLELVFNTDKYRAHSMQKRHRRMSQAVNLADVSSVQQRLRKIAHSNDNGAVSSSFDRSGVNMAVVDLNRGHTNTAADVNIGTPSESVLSVAPVHMFSYDRQLLAPGEESRTPKLSRFQQFSTSGGAQSEMNANHDDSASHTNNSVDSRPGNNSPSLSANVRQRKPSIRKTSGAQYSSILVDDFNPVTNHHVQQDSNATDDVSYKSAVDTQVRQPKLSFVGEMEERERHSRPPRLSVVFAGIIENDTEFADAAAPHHVILDCSSTSFVDTAGVTMLVEFVRECRKKSATQVFLVHCPRNVREQIRRNHTICRDDLPDSCFFPTIHDAALYSIAIASNTRTQSLK